LTLGRGAVAGGGMRGKFAAEERGAGATSPGRQSHADIALYSSFAIIYTKYTGRRQRYVTVHALGATPKSVAGEPKRAQAKNFGRMV
jgi:hypothetical protein